MKLANSSFVPLQQANLCLDCEMITVAQSDCPVCGSTALMNIARALSQPMSARAHQLIPSSFPENWDC